MWYVTKKKKNKELHIVQKPFFFAFAFLRDLLLYKLENYKFLKFGTPGQLLLLAPTPKHDPE